MKRIYKYALADDFQQTIEMPADAHILTVQTQDNRPCLWAIVDPTKPRRPVTVTTIYTGDMAPDLMEIGIYIGTCQTFHGPQGVIVSHIFVKF